MARLNVPDGPGGEAAMIWSLRPQLGDMVEHMIRGAYQQSILPADERELARMRIAQINDCMACADFRAQSVLDAGVSPELYDNVAAYASYPGYTPRQRLCIEYAERFATDHASLDDAFFQRLRELFSDEEILDLTLCVAVFLGLGRSLSVLGVDQSCAIDLLTTRKELMDIATVDELLSTTRSVRKRLDLTRPVSREVILECIQLAMQAPTASNTQDWRWLVITDADKRAAIAEIYRSIGAQYLAYAADNATDPQTRRVYQSAMSLTETLADVPVHVIPCIEQRIDGAELGIAAAAWASIIPAGWSFLLALRSRGLGSVWTTMHLFKEQEVAELLGIPPTVTQAALFPVAYTIGTDFRPAKRPPAETITLWNKWIPADGEG